MIPTKTFADLTYEGKQALLAAGYQAVTAGSVVRNLLDVFNKQLESAYKTMDLSIAMCFVSTAEGRYLDMLGELLGVTRLSTETDINYRYRISQHSFSAAQANATSLRLACLSEPYVKNIIMTPYTAGNGSFTIHVITDELDTPTSVLRSVEAVVEKTKAAGIKATIASPTLVPVDFSFNIVLKNNATENGDNLALQIKNLLQDVLDNVQIGGIINIYGLIKEVQVMANVAYAYVNSINVNEDPVIIKQSYKMAWDTRPYIRNVSVTIMEG